MASYRNVDNLPSFLLLPQAPVVQEADDISPKEPLEEIVVRLG